jgi:hypothetical protein
MKRRLRKEDIPAEMLAHRWDQAVAEIIAEYRERAEGAPFGCAWFWRWRARDAERSVGRRRPPYREMRDRLWDTLVAEGFITEDGRLI